LTPGI